MWRWRWNGSRALAVAAGLLAWMGVAPAQEPVVAFRPFQPAPDWLGRRVAALAQGPSGFLWIASGTEVWRFDGREAIAFEVPPRGPRLRMLPQVRCLTEAPDGTLWVGTRHGVLRLSPGASALRYVTEADDEHPLGEPVLGLAIDATGKVWVQIPDRLLRWDPARDEVRVMLQKGGRVESVWASALAQGPAGRIWIASSKGEVLRWDEMGDEWQAVVLPIAGDTPPRAPVAALSPWSAEGALVAVRGRVFEVRFDGSQGPGVIEVPWQAAGGSGMPRALGRDGRGRIWIGTDQGLHRVDQGRVASYRGGAGVGELVGASVDRLLLDRHGLLWVATEGGLCSCEPDPPVEAWAIAERHADDAALCVLGDGPSTIVGSRSRQVLRRDADGALRRQPLPEAAEKGVRAVPVGFARDRLGVAWVASRGGMLCPLGPDGSLGEPLRHDPADPASFSSCGFLALHAGADGFLYVGTEQGIDQFDPVTRRVRRLPLPPASSGRRRASVAFHGIADCRSGGLWVLRVHGGLTHLDPQTGQVRELRLHSPDGLAIPEGHACLLDRGDGTLLLGGSQGLWLAVTATGALRRASADPRLRDDAVLALRQTPDGSIWAAAPRRGLLGLDADLRVTGRHTVADGLPDDRFIIGSLADGPDGTLLAACGRFVLRIDPRRLAVPRPGPPVVLTAFAVFERPQPMPAVCHEFEVGGDSNFFSFRFAGLDFLRPENHRYQYRLRGFDPNWVDGGAVPVARYTNVPPGSYTFEVRSAHAEGPWSAPQLGIALAVTPAVWQTAWFRSAIAALAVGLLLLYLSYALRLRSRNRQLVAAATRREQAERELAVSQERLLAAGRSELAGRLAGGLAHDLNNFLTAILGQIDLARLRTMRLPGAEDALGELAATSAMVQRGTGLTRRLLAFAQSREAPRERILPGDALRELQPMLQSVLGAGVDLRLRIEDGVPAIEAEPGHLDQIVLNLAINAQDAMPQGGAFEVELRRGDDDARPVELVVQDTGCGMPADVVARVFEPFFTTKPVGKGTGLGLTIVQGVVEQLRGEIAVASEPGRGTTFRIRLPAAATGVALPRQGTEVAPPPEATPVPATILVCDDDEAVRRIMAVALGEAGFHVIAAADGEAALEQAGAAGPIALLVTDLVMPGMNGVELAQRLWGRQALLRTLFVSGYAAETLRNADLPPGRVELLHKPFLPRELVQRVTELLAAHAG